MEPAVGVEDSGGGDDVDVRVSEEKIAESLESHHEPGLAAGAVGAEAKPGGDGEMGGVAEVVEQRAVAEKERADEARHGEHDVPMGHGGADGVGDEGTFDERAALVARGAETALLAGKCEEEFVIAVGAAEAGEAGVEVAAVEEGVDGGGGFGGEAGDVSGMIVENLPEGRSAGLAGTVADADHLGSGSRRAGRHRGQERAIPKSWGKARATCAKLARSQTHRFWTKSAINGLCG